MVRVHYSTDKLPSINGHNRNPSSIAGLDDVKQDAVEEESVNKLLTGWANKKCGGFCVTVNAAAATGKATAI